MLISIKNKLISTLDIAFEGFRLHYPTKLIFSRFFKVKSISKDFKKLSIFTYFWINLVFDYFYTKIYSYWFLSPFQYLTKIVLFLYFNENRFLSKFWFFWFLTEFSKYKNDFFFIFDKNQFFTIFGHFNAKRFLSTPNLILLSSVLVKIHFRPFWVNSFIALSTSDWTDYALPIFLLKSISQSLNIFEFWGIFTFYFYFFDRWSRNY